MTVIERKKADAENLEICPRSHPEEKKSRGLNPDRLFLLGELF
jgi:hypothetical protein